MRLIASTALAVLVTLTASAQTPSPQKPARPQSAAERLAEFERMAMIESRVDELRPRRRDTPLRDLNITDNEVREIQALAARYKMDTMLNISPVVAGCPCEDGPLCTDQVYIVSELPANTVGLQLSRVRNAWVVGPVQRWWLKYASFKSTETTTDYYKFRQAKNNLLLEFPMCVGKGEPAKTTTAQTREATK